MTIETKLRNTAAEKAFAYSARLSGWMILLMVLFFSSTTLSQIAPPAYLTLQADSVPLVKVMEMVRKQGNYHFIYDNSLMDQSRPVTVHSTKVTLPSLLEEIFRSQPFTYQLKGNFIIVTPKSKKVSIGNPLKKHFSGKVVVAGTGTPLSEANVFLNGKHISTSDENGFFESDWNGVTDSLHIEAFNYQSFDSVIPVFPTDTIVFTLIQIDHLLDSVEVFSTGYQQLPKERATGSFDLVNNELFNRRVSMTVLDRLEGVSNVYFDRRNGGNSLSIRGRSTILANATPLIIVDNFPYDGDISNLNPNDIANVTVLKDAAAASIWGVRAGNGVIVITTKKGSYEKKTVVEVNNNMTLGQKLDLFYSPDFLNPASFIEVEQILYAKGYYTSSINNMRTFPILSPVVEILASGSIDASSKIQALSSHDVRSDYDKYYYRQSLSQQYAMNMSGGSGMHNYFLSVGYDKVLPSLSRNSEQRVTLRVDNNFKPIKSLSFNLGINYTKNRSENNNPGTNFTLSGNKKIYPYARLADESGNPLPVVNNYRQGFTDSAGSGLLQDWSYRPLEELRLGKGHSSLQDFKINAGLNYQLTSHYGLNILYQMEDQTIDQETLYGKQSYTARNLINYYSVITGGLIRYGIPLGGIMDQANNKLVSQSIRGQLNLHPIDKTLHQLTLLIGGEIRQSKIQTSKDRTWGYDEDRLTYGNVDYKSYTPTYFGSSALIPNPANFSELLLRYVSYYANGAYTLNKKYVFSFSGRKDASNLFGVNSNQKAVPLWSSGFKWKISQEPFFPVGWINRLEWRTTYGFNGNVSNNLSALTTIQYLNNAQLTGSVYAKLRNPPNPELRWEKNSILNMGLDFALLNDRISGSLEYYLRNGKDLIGRSPIDPTTGTVSLDWTFSYMGNVAQMKGRGWELQLNTLNFSHKSLAWKTDLLFSYVKNYVSQYNYTNSIGSTYVGGGTTITPVTGQPVYSVITYKWAGLDPETGNPVGYLDGKKSMDYAALSNVGTEDLDYHGSAIPTIYGSFRNTIDYKRFSLSANIMYKLRYYFLRSSINYQALFANWQGHQDYAKRWQKQGDEQRTDVPSMVYPNTSTRDNFYNYSSALVEPGDHIRLQDINLSYSFDVLRRGGIIKKLIGYFYLNNVGILWRKNHKSLDPDYPTGTPIPRTYSLGIKCTL